MKIPYLSVVAVSRNDDHGGDPLRRTQIFINSLAWQAKHFGLETELVLVDWNPPANKAGLAEVLTFPANDFFTARVIVVSPDLHLGYRHGDRLQLFQMIGKNVGIRRARGEFVLATNIDIVFDDTLIEYISQKKLDPRLMCRADRFDIANTLPDEGHEAQQQFCRNADNLIRKNQRLHPAAFAKTQAKDGYSPKASLNQNLFEKEDWAKLTVENGVHTLTVNPDMPADYISTNACGDFTLMHKDAWADVRGYGEFEAFSMHIDSIGCIYAHKKGYLDTTFLPPLVCYHIEHTPASGWTPEAGDILFERVCKKGIPMFDWEITKKTLIADIYESDLCINDEHWGLKDVDLPEAEFSTNRRVEYPGAEAKPPVAKSLSAIRQELEPGILYQTVHFKKTSDIDYEYFKRITSRRLWTFVHWQIRCFQVLNKAFRRIVRTGES